MTLVRSPQSYPHPLPSHPPLRPGVERLLDAPARRQVLDAVTRHPGIPVGELQAMLDMGWGTLHHHLQKLVDAGLLRTQAVGRRRIVHLAGAGSHRGLALLRGKTVRRVALAIVRHPEAGIAELPPLCGESPRVVYYHVKRLVEAGLVSTGGPTRYARLAPDPLLPELLQAAPASGE